MRGSSQPSPLTLLLAAGYLLLAGAQLLSSQMFLDGVVYAAIARNLAEGSGSFWALHYTDTISPFYEHPPLAIWLQSLAFRVAGDAPWVERMWGLLLGGITIVVMMRLMALALRRDDTLERSAAKGMGWYPALIFIAFPLTVWSLANNFLENTLLLFTLMAVLLCLRGLLAARTATMLRDCAGAALLLFLALLCKGPPALFVLAVPFAARLFLCGVTTPRALGATLLLFTLPALGGALLLLAGGEGVRDFLHHYVEVQLWHSIEGRRELSGTPLLIPLTLLQNLALPLLLLLPLQWLQRATPGATASPRNSRQWGHLYLAIALASSLPFTLFPKQMEWYLLPSLPYYALAISLYLLRSGLALRQRLQGSPRLRQVCYTLSAIMATLFALALARFSGILDVSPAIYLRDSVANATATISPWQSEYTWRLFRHDILLQPRQPKRGATITHCQPELHDQWRITAYLQRYYAASLTPHPGGEYLLLDTQQPLCPIPAGCVSLAQHEPLRLQLWQCPVYRQQHN